MSSGIFLGLMVNHKRIEANPEKNQALQDLKSPINFKELQKLTNMIVAMNIFSFKCSDRCRLSSKLDRSPKCFCGMKNVIKP